MRPNLRADGIIVYRAAGHRPSGVSPRPASSPSGPRLTWARYRVRPDGVASDDAGRLAHLSQAGNQLRRPGRRPAGPGTSIMSADEGAPGPWPGPRPVGRGHDL